MLERFLDSVILIDHFNDIARATEFILGLNQGKTSISVISRAEILVGFDENSIEKAASFIFTLHFIEKWQRHPAADLRGWKPLLQFIFFSSNKSVNYF